MDNYDLIQKLGEGSFGKVWKAKNKQTGEIVAIKSTQIPNENMRKLVLNEISLLYKVSQPCYPFIVCYKDHFIDGETVYIVMEYIDGETLDDFSKRFRQQGRYNDLYIHLLALARDMRFALDHLHKNGIIHRDIKPENIMITKEGVPKLIDIGLSCFVIEKCNLDSRKLDCCLGDAGSPNFMSPETLLQKRSFYSSDIWSLGASIFNSATGQYLYYPNPPTILMLKRVVAGQNPPVLSTSNQELNQVVNNMLKKNPLLRRF